MDSDRPVFMSGRPKPASSSLKWPSSPQALNFLGGFRLIVLRLRRLFLGEYHRGLKHFWSQWVCLGYDPALGNTKKALCHSCLVGRTYDKYRRRLPLTTLPIILLCIRDEVWSFLSLRVFGLLPLSSLVYSQCFGWCVLLPSWGVSSQIRLCTQNFKPKLLFNQRGRVFWFCWLEPGTSVRLCKYFFYLRAVKWLPKDPSVETLWIEQ